MRKKLLSITLSSIMVLSTVSFAFAEVDLDNPPTEPTKPKVESYQDNDKIEDYNTKAEDYNQKADEYNSAVDKEYDKAVEDVNKKNAEGQQKQAESQKIHDEAVEKNKEIEKYNKEVDKKYEEDTAKYNAEKEQYNKDLEKYNTDMEQYRSDFNQQYNAEIFKTKEEYENFAKSKNEVFERDKIYHEKTKDRGISNKTNDVNGLPADFNNLDDTENPKTITVERGEPSQNTYKVVVIALYLVGTNEYFGSGYELEKYGTLNPNIYNYLVQTKWESATVGENDTVTVQSEAISMIKYSNGNFFNYVDDNYLEGYWYLSSTERGTMDVLDWGWKSIYSQTGFDDNVYIIYTYAWQGKYPIAIMPTEPEEAQKGEYKNKVDVPDVYNWNDLPLPIKRAYLNHIPLLELLIEPESLDNFLNVENSIGFSNRTIAATNNKPDETKAKEKPTTDINNTKLPLTSISKEGHWALINLIATILTIILALILLIMIFINKRKEDEKITVNNKVWLRIIEAIIAIFSGIIFLITEDTTLPMKLTDEWTILMIVILIINIIIAILSRRKIKKEEDEEKALN